jgi:hypothetical protein
MTRQRPPNRRPSVTTVLQFENNSYSTTLGIDPHTNRIAEIFTHGAKVGSGMDLLLDDACVAISLLLQYGVEPKALASSMGRVADGKTPASIIGALTDLIATEVVQ